MIAATFIIHIRTGSTLTRRIFRGQKENWGLTNQIIVPFNPEHVIPYVVAWGWVWIRNIWFILDFWVNQLDKSSEKSPFRLSWNKEQLISALRHSRLIENTVEIH